MGGLLRNNPRGEGNSAFAENSSEGAGEELLLGMTVEDAEAATRPRGPLVTAPRGRALHLHLLFFSSSAPSPPSQSKSRLLCPWGHENPESGSASQAWPLRAPAGVGVSGQSPDERRDGLSRPLGAAWGAGGRARQTTQPPCFCARLEMVQVTAQEERAGGGGRVASGVSCGIRGAPGRRSGHGRREGRRLQEQGPVWTGIRDVVGFRASGPAGTRHVPSATSGPERELPRVRLVHSPA